MKQGTRVFVPDLFVVNRIDQNGNIHLLSLDHKGTTAVVSSPNLLRVASKTAGQKREKSTLTGGLGYPVKVKTPSE